MLLKEFSEILEGRGLVKKELLHFDKVVNENRKTENTKPQKQPNRIITKKIGRNDPCPCGSGKKYKTCHGS